MKKLSIILALIMALSCFSVTAFAQEEASSTEATTVEEVSSTEATTAEEVSSTEAETTVPVVETTTAATTAAATTTVAAPATVIVNIVLQKVDKTTETYSYTYSMKAGTVLTAADVLAAAKGRLDESGKAIIDTEEYIMPETVIAEDAYGEYLFNKTTVDAGETYEYTVLATEIDDVKNLAVTIGEQLAKLDWGGIAKANVALWNQIINASKAAIDSLVNAEWPTAEDKAEATEATTAAAEETPDTGVSAVAGAAVVVLALSATTAVVLRKKED